MFAALRWKRALSLMLCGEIAGVRIGLFGLGISPVALITPSNFKGVTYQDPMAASRGVVKILKRERTLRLDCFVCHI